MSTEALKNNSIVAKHPSKEEMDQIELSVYGEISQYPFNEPKLKVKRSKKKTTSETPPAQSEPEQKQTKVVVEQPPKNL